MTNVSTIPTVVQAPLLKPAPTGIVVTAGLWGGVVDDPDGHWLNGIAWSPENDSVPDLIDPCDTTPSWGDPDVTRSPSAEALPFVVTVEDKCSTFGFGGTDLRERAIRALLAKEQTVVERQMALGELASANRFLADDTADGFITVAGGTAQTPARALALLNEAIADAYIGQGVIHASAMLVELWQEAFGLRQDASGRLLTANGNYIVAGNGYHGDGPGGADGSDGDVSTNHTVEWAYATDLFNLYRGAQQVYPDTVAEATDRDLNFTTFRATRPWAIEWSGLLHAAVKVTV